MGQGRWFDSQIHKAATVPSVIFPKSTFWDTLQPTVCTSCLPTNHCLSMFQILSLQGPDSAAWDSHVNVDWLQSRRAALSSPFPATGGRLLEVTQRDFSWNTQGWHECKCSAGAKVQVCLGMTTITTWLPRSRACGRTQFHCWTCCLSASATHLWFRVEWLSGCPFSHSLWCSLYSNCSG